MIPPMPIIMGAPRSGTTLLRMMLDAHPALAIPPETGFLGLAGAQWKDQIADRDVFFSLVSRFPPDAPGWQDFGIPDEQFRAELDRIRPFEPAEGFRAFYRLYATKMGKPRWGDKTPTYVHFAAAIHAMLPETHFIHVVRDGRDSCLSWRQTWFRPGDDVAMLAMHWRHAVLAGREQGRRCPAYMEIRYEDLVRDPRGSLQAICRFVRLDFDPAMLRYYEGAPERLKELRERRQPDGTIVVTHQQRLRNQQMTTQPLDPGRISVWQTLMTAAEKAEFLRIAGDALRVFGYEA